MNSVGRYNRTNVTTNGRQEGTRVAWDLPTIPKKNAPKIKSLLLFKTEDRIIEVAYKLLRDHNLTLETHRGIAGT